jgi:hypothetical protein
MIPVLIPLSTNLNMHIILHSFNFGNDSCTASSSMRKKQHHRNHNGNTPLVFNPNVGFTVITSTCSFTVNLFCVVSAGVEYEFKMANRCDCATGIVSSLNEVKPECNKQY